jgi:multicomponent Na+:H+ antiporter subunit E
VTRVLGALRAAALRAGMLGAAWWAVAEGSGTAWGLGLAVVALATGASLWLQPAGGSGVRLRAVPRFAVFFVRRSVVGGIDVAVRAVRRPVDVDPGEVEVPARLPAGWSRVLLADAVSVLPGTLAVETRANVLVLHVLDRQRPYEDEVSRLEGEIVRLLGLRVPPGGPG